MPIAVAVLAQGAEGESRVALAPAGVKKLTGMKASVLVESAAGLRAGFRDTEYESAGATVTSDPNLLHNADVVLVVRQPPLDRVGQLKSGAILIGLLSPLGDRDIVDALCN